VIEESNHQRTFLFDAVIRRFPNFAVCRILLLKSISQGGASNKLIMVVVVVAGRFSKSSMAIFHIITRLQIGDHKRRSRTSSNKVVVNMGLARIWCIL
jgi:hypothetical protein